MRGMGFNELEAIAKSVSLTNGGIHPDWAKRKRKLQLHKLAQRNLELQHGCDSGFADVHGPSHHHAGRAGINSYINIHPEAGIAPCVGHALAKSFHGLVLSVQASIPQDTYRQRGIEALGGTLRPGPFHFSRCFSRMIVQVAMCRTVQHNLCSDQEESPGTPDSELTT